MKIFGSFAKIYDLVTAHGLPAGDLTPRSKRPHYLRRRFVIFYYVITNPKCSECEDEYENVCEAETRRNNQVWWVPRAVAHCIVYSFYPPDSQEGDEGAIHRQRFPRAVFGDTEILLSGYFIYFFLNRDTV